MKKDINLQISKKLEERLTKLGAIVYLTRYGDYDLSLPDALNRKRSDLSNRSNIINKSKCDLFLSLHLNAEQSEIWSGPQVFYDDNNSQNKKIAKCQICNLTFDAEKFKSHQISHPSKICDFIYLGSYQNAINQSELKKLKINGNKRFTFYSL